ncbi:MAG: CPBP family intramembrane metalloprotease [Candidatus Electrothrix sp. AW5]|nr:CPBP family intramembrane metalloprotease [Candidatus Electrothrix gigas]MCI5225117.1 CPBP family intramembrane metalloprotease [Candidatus Electrothrix gigas]
MSYLPLPSSIASPLNLGENLVEFQENQSVNLPRLTARRAFSLFILFISLQLLVGLVVGFATGMVAQISHQAAMLFATISGFLLASLTVLYLAVRWFPREINKNSMTGAAWRVGSRPFLLLGGGGGVFIAFSYLFLAPLLSTPPDETAIGPFTKMANTPGLQQIIAFFIALILAPPVEELLFRGVMFGGFCRSFGPIWAAVLTTSLFVAAHFVEAIHFWPAFVFIALMALAALWLRLYTRSIGPSIALHFSYNLILTGATLLGTLLAS